MDEVDVNIWYDDEKQKLFDKFVEELNDPSKRKAAEESFNKKMDKLITKYYGMMDKAIAHEARRKKIEKMKKSLLKRFKKEKKDEEDN